MDFQVQEDLLGCDASQKEHLGKYLALMIFAHRLEGLERSLQPSFNIRALWTAEHFLIPRPPEHIGLQMEIHDFQKRCFSRPPNPTINPS